MKLVNLVFVLLTVLCGQKLAAQHKKESTAIQAVSKENKENEWILFDKNEGVEFYLLNKKSNVNPTVNTLLKLQNTNNYQIVISFIPQVICSNEMSENYPKEELFIEANQHNLLTYQICKQGTFPKINLKELKINKR